MKRKKLLVVAVLGLMFSLTGAAFTFTEVATADTAPKPYTVVKIEDAADTLSDIPWHVKGTNVTTTNEILTDSTANYALYTKAATEENKDKNPNAYDGNLGLYCSSGLINGFTMDREWNDLVNFKMNYIEGDTTWLFARKSSFKSWDWVSSYEGYSFRINGSKICNIKKQTQASDTGAVTLVSSNVAQSFVNGEILDITYGVYDVVDNATYDYNNDGTADGDGTYVYFKIVGEKVNMELHAKDNDPTPVYRGTDSEKNYMQIVTGMSIAWYKGPISIQGVEQPILNDVYDYAVEGTYNVGTSGSEIELPLGYKIEDGQTLAEGTNKLQATYTLAEYLGKTNVSIDCKVTVNAEVLETYTVRQLRAGTEIDSEEVVAGAEYTLPAVEASAGKKFVGWSIADNLYQVGDKITINADIEISVVEVSFSQGVGASIRMKTDDKGRGGIRFEAKLTDTGNITGKYAWKGFIMPKNLVTGLDASTIDRASRNEVLMTVQDLAKENVYFTISSLAQTSFDTEFVCVSYLEITYADGDKATIFAWDSVDAAQGNARSAKNVAELCLEDKTKDWDTTAQSYFDYYRGITTSIPTEE